MPKKRAPQPVSRDEDMPGMPGEELERRMSGSAGERLTARLQEIGWTPDQEPSESID